MRDKYCEKINGKWYCISIKEYKENGFRMKTATVQNINKLEETNDKRTTERGISP